MVEHTRPTEAGYAILQQLTGGDILDARVADVQSTVAQLLEN